jgi:hypothetical protein
VVTFAALGFVDRLGRRAHDAVDLLAARGLARGGLLCVLIEAGQILLPSRHAELADLAVNVGALTLGHVGASALLTRTSTWACGTSRLWPAPGVRRVSLAAWGLLWFGVILFPASLVTLDGWDPRYPLLVGNEITGERAWQGELTYLAFYDRAFAADELSGRLRTPPSKKDGKSARLEAGLVADYDLSKAYRRVIESDGVLEAPAGWLSARLTAADAFSVEAWVRPATLHQTGPARITSVSESPYRRNFTLGQEGGAYHFRVRNGMNGENGTRHELVCHGVTPGVLQQIVATYDRGVSKIFRDGRLMCPALDLREPSVMLGLGAGRISGMVTALVAALSLMLATGVPADWMSLGRLLAVGYAWLLASLIAGFYLSFPPAPSIYVWFGPALVLSWMCLTWRISRVSE